MFNKSKVVRLVAKLRSGGWHNLDGMLDQRDVIDILHWSGMLVSRDDGHGGLEYQWIRLVDPARTYTISSGDFCSKEMSYKSVVYIDNDDVSPREMDEVARLNVGESTMLRTGYKVTRTQ